MINFVNYYFDSFILRNISTCLIFSIGSSNLFLSLPSYEGGVSGETLVEPSLPSYEGSVSGESLVEPSLPSYEGGVSGDPSVEPSLPSYEGGVSGEPEIQEALPEYKEEHSTSSDQSGDQSCSL